MVEDVAFFLSEPCTRSRRNELLTVRHVHVLLLPRLKYQISSQISITNFVTLFCLIRQTRMLLATRYFSMRAMFCLSISVIALSREAGVAHATKGRALLASSSSNRSSRWMGSQRRNVSSNAGLQQSNGSPRSCSHTVQLSTYWCNATQSSQLR